MPFRTTADRSRRYGIALSSGTAHSIMRRPEASLGTPTADTATAMRRAGILHIDETSLYLNCRTVRVQILYDPSTGHALYTIHGSCGADVLSKDAGELGRHNSVRQLICIQGVLRPALPVPHNTQGKGFSRAQS